MSLLYYTLVSAFPVLGFKLLDYSIFENEGKYFQLFNSFLPEFGRDVYALARCTISIPMNFTSNLIEVERDEEGNPIVDVYIGEIVTDMPFIVIAPRIAEIRGRKSDLYRLLTLRPTPFQVYEIRGGGGLEIPNIETFSSTLREIESISNVELETLNILKHLTPIYREIIERWRSEIEPYLTFPYRFYAGFISRDELGEVEPRQLVEFQIWSGLKNIIDALNQLASLESSNISVHGFLGPFTVRSMGNEPSRLSVGLSIVGYRSSMPKVKKYYTYTLGGLADVFRFLGALQDFFQSIPLKLSEVENLMYRYSHIYPYLRLLRSLLAGEVYGVPLEKVEELTNRIVREIVKGRPVQTITEIVFTRSLSEPFTHFGIFRQETPKAWSSMTIPTLKASQFLKMIERDKTSQQSPIRVNIPEVVENFTTLKLYYKDIEKCRGKYRSSIDLLKSITDAIRETFNIEPIVVPLTDLESFLNWEEIVSIPIVTSPKILTVIATPVKISENWSNTQHLLSIYAPTWELDRVKTFLERLREKLKNLEVKLRESGELGSIGGLVIELSRRQ